MADTTKGVSSFVNPWREFGHNIGMHAKMVRVIVGSHQLNM